jgi:hypothetical protein
MLVLLVAGRQKHDNVTVYGVSFKVALKRLALNLDVFNGHRFRARDDWRYQGLDLPETQAGVGKRQRNEKSKRAERFGFHDYLHFVA